MDIEFDTLLPLLRRDKNCSTEILINLHMPISHRLGSRNAVLGDEPIDSRIESYHEKLTRVYGGDYWKNDLILKAHASAKDRERALVGHYREKLSSTGYLTYTGACPIRETSESATKYFMVFASRHPDSMLLFNDEMCKSYNRYIHEQDTHDTLFAALTWQDWRDPGDLQEIVLKYIPDDSSETRKAIWLRIVKDHFMHFTSSEYIKTIRNLRQFGQIECFESNESGVLRSANHLKDDTIIRLARQKTLL